MVSTICQHCHVTHEGVECEEYTPAHPPRVETPEYRKAHDFLVHQKKSPCAVCGVNVDTLSDPTVNLFGATAIETHHFPIERSLMDACDPLKVHKDFPVVYDKDTLAAFVDSPGNLLVLCSSCHRSPDRGIHHLLTQDFAVLKYLYKGYVIVGSDTNKAQALNIDEAIEQANGLESA